MEMAVLEKGESVAKLGSGDGAEWTGRPVGEGKAGGEGKDSTGESAQLSLPPRMLVGGGVLSC